MKFDLSNDECKLVNLRNSEKINGSMTNSNSKEIDLPIIQEVAKNGKRIVLSDDSVWFSSTRGFKKWQRGNRVIVSPLDRVEIDTITHTLINIDKWSEDKNCKNYSPATLVK